MVISRPVYKRGNVLTRRSRFQIYFSNGEITDVGNLDRRNEGNGQMFEYLGNFKKFTDTV